MTEEEILAAIKAAYLAGFKEGEYHGLAEAFHERSEVQEGRLAELYAETFFVKDKIKKKFKFLGR